MTLEEVTANIGSHAVYNGPDTWYNGKTIVIQSVSEGKVQVRLVAGISPHSLAALPEQLTLVP